MTSRVNSVRLNDMEGSIIESHIGWGWTGGRVI